MSPFFTAARHRRFRSITNIILPVQNPTTPSPTPQAQPSPPTDDTPKTMSTHRYTSRGTQTLPVWDCSVVWSTTSGGASTIATSVASEGDSGDPPLMEKDLEEVKEKQPVVQEWEQKKEDGTRGKKDEKKRQNRLRKGMKKGMKKGMMKKGKGSKRFGQAVVDSFLCGYLEVYGKYAVKF